MNQSHSFISVRLRSARKYLYRNLHTGTFSVKFRGKVTHHPDFVIMNDVEFKVSEKGRNRVLNEKQKNVHAYVAYLTEDDTIDVTINVDKLREVCYNPYLYNCFVLKDSGEPIFRATKAFAYNNKIYIKSEEYGDEYFR